MINAITSLKMPKSVSKVSEVKSDTSVLKLSSTIATAKLTSLCDKKSTDNGLKDSLIKDRAFNDSGTPLACSTANSVSHGSSSRAKPQEVTGRSVLGALKCRSASATPIMSRLSHSNKNDSLGLASPCRRGKGRDLFEIFPSSENNSKWWEVLLPLKKDSNNVGNPAGKQNSHVKENLLKVPQPQSDKLRKLSSDIKKNGSHSVLTKLDSGSVKEQGNVKSVRK